MAEHVLHQEFPRLPDDRRVAVVAFVNHRVDTLPSVTRLGVLVVAACSRALLALPGDAALRIAARLPVLGEYPRLLRSLASAYIWETWPDTATDGSAR